MRVRILISSLSLALWVQSAAAQERFQTLEVGAVTYSNVTVVSKTTSDLWIQHACGLANIKVRDLDSALATRLGYEIDRASQSRRLRLSMPAIKVDPRVEQMQAKLSQDVQTRFQGMALGIMGGVVALTILAHLFFCYCCLLICRKAGSPAGFLIWFPFLQLFPLFRAAGMSSWSVLGLCTPQVFGVLAAVAAPPEVSLNSPRVILLLALGVISLLVPIVISIRWCVKICQARNKSAWLALLLLFPLTSFFSFLYLAFSNGEEEEEEANLPNPNYVTFSR